MRCCKYTILFFLSALSQSYSFGQTVSVNHITGGAQAHVPIWSVTDRSLAVDIGLSYYNGGVEVGVPAGNAGVGWNITGLGQVTRELRGLPDDHIGGGNDYRRGWLIDSSGLHVQEFIQSSENSNPNTCSDEEDDWNYLTGLSYLKDTEPDLFYINAPGLSLQFIFDGAGAPKTIPYSEHTLNVYKTSGAIDSIKVIKDDGTVYSFHQGTRITKHSIPNGAQPVTFFKPGFHQYKDTLSYTSTWDLKSMVSLDGGRIDYSYGSQDSDLSVFPRQIIKKNSQNVDEVQTLYYEKTIVRKRQLASISSKNYTIAFNYMNGKVIDQIEVFDSTTPVSTRTFGLKYYSVKSANDTYYYSTNRRYFLKEVAQMIDCNGIPPYRFLYNGLTTSGYATQINMSFNTDGKETDFWGYANGKSESQMPPVFYYSTASGAEKFRSYEGAVAATEVLGTPGVRDADINYCALGSLSQVFLPEGGLIGIAYELNQYWDSSTSSNISGGGVRVKSINRKANLWGTSPINTEYVYSNASDQSYGAIAYPPSYAFAYNDEIIRTTVNMAPEQGVWYRKVKEKSPGNGYIVFEFNLPTAYPVLAYESWASPHSYYARRPDSTCLPVGKMGAGQNAYPFPPQPDYDFANGLTAKVSVYNEADQLINETGYSYLTTGGTEAQVYGLKYDLSDNYAWFSKYKLTANITKSLQSQWSRIMDETTTTNYLYDSLQVAYIASTNVPFKTTTYTSDGSKTVQKAIYTRDFAFSIPYGNTEEVIEELKGKGAKNLIVEEVVYKDAEGAANMLASSLTTYQKNSLNQYVLKEKLLSEKNASFAEAQVVVTEGKHKLNYDASYILNTSITEFDQSGNATTISNGKKGYSGVHYGYGRRWPIVHISNAKANEVAFSNFEGTCSYGFSEPVGASYPVGRTGSKAITLTSTGLLSATAIEKSPIAMSYIFSCWTKASAERTVSLAFKNTSGNIIATNNLSYGVADINAWKFKELNIDVSSFPSVFTLEISSGGNIDLDDVLIYPNTALITHNTMDPLKGPVSISDTKGRFTTIKYDTVGRKENMSDQDDNLLQAYDYFYYDNPKTLLTAKFSYPGSTTVIPGTSKTFTADADQCFEGEPSYKWSVDDTELGEASSQEFTFSLFKNYDVKLTKIFQQDTANYSVTVKSEPINFSISSFTLQNSGSDSITNCDLSYERTFSAPGVSTNSCSGSQQELVYKWYYVCDGVSDWQQIDVPEDSDELVFDISAYFTPRTYTVKCVVFATCSSEDQPGLFVEASGEDSLTITYTGGQHCL